MFHSKWKYCVFSAGFGGITGQVILLRQVETIFGGNELSVGAFFAPWLIWSGIGAWLGRFVKKGKAFYTLLALQGAILIVSVWLCRLWLSLSGNEGGVIAGLTDMVIGGTALTALFALNTGMLFTLGIKASSAEPREVYLWEAVGAAAAGIFCAIMLGKIGHFQFAFLILGLNLTAALGRPHFQSLGALVGLLGFIWAGPIWEKVVLETSWLAQELIAHEQSVYADIAVFEQNGQYSVYRNGELSDSYPNPLAAEEAVHFALLTHPAPKKVFIIGGGFSGTVAEILKHPSVKEVDYAEIDSKLIEILGKTFPLAARNFLDDARVHIINADGRWRLKTASAEYDVIILALPDPTTALVNRYYTVEFFKEAKKALKPGGIFAFSMNSSEDYIDSSLAHILGGVKRSLEMSFRRTELLPGGKCYFIASDCEFETGLDCLLKRLDERNIENDFINRYFLPYRLSEERRDYLQNSLRMDQGTWLNRDFHPLGFIKTLDRWERQFHPSQGSIHWLLQNFKPGFALALAAGLALIIMIASKGPRFEKCVGSAVSLGGFSQMGMQIMLILGFQSIFGYMYYQQAVLIAGFMVGAGLGSFTAGRWENKEIGKKRTSFVFLQSWMFILPIIILAVLFIGKEFGGLSKHLLTLSALICGWTGGMHYSIGAMCLSGETSKRGGGLYALDLAGSALGAVLGGILMIPILGFVVTGLILCSANLIPLLGVAVYKSKS